MWITRGLYLIDYLWYYYSNMQEKKESVKYSNELLKTVQNLPKHRTPEFLNEVAEMIPKDNTPIILSSEHESFLRFYVQGQETRNKVYLSVAMAKGVDLDTLSRENEMHEVTRKRQVFTEEKPSSSEYDKKVRVLATMGNRWLRTPKGNARRMQLTSELLKDNIVDNEMTKVITQDKDLNAKNTAIREYNKLKQRIVDRKDIRTQSVGVVRHLYSEADTFDYGNE